MQVARIDAAVDDPFAGVVMLAAVGTDAVGQPALLANLLKQPRRHAPAEHRREHLEDVPVGMADRVARDAEHEVRLVRLLRVDADARADAFLEKTLKKK
jgi:hypothetical protein